MPRAACSAIAATTCGWQWPVELTAMPAAKSRYSSPSTVVTRHPRPLATWRSVTLNQTPDRCVMGGNVVPRDGRITRRRRSPTDFVAAGVVLRFHLQRGVADAVALAQQVARPIEHVVLVDAERRP